MQITSSKFKYNAKQAIQDSVLRAKVKKATETSLQKRKAVIEEIPDWEELRERAHRIREDVVRNLDRYIEKFSQAAQRNGIQVHFAKNAKEANTIVTRITKRVHAKTVVKSKSMITEEIELNKALEENGIPVIETDLGEYIIQLAGEPPSHITAPAMHKSREDIGKLFAQKFNIPFTDQPEELTKFTRTKLKEEFLNARVGITGVNFACADTGSLAVVENEGNVRMCTVLPDVHIAIMSIEKIIPSLSDLPLFLKLLTRSATGQRITSYISVITGTRSKQNPDGPKQIHLVILDNGRSRLAKHPEWKQGLYCIKCGACMNVCPIYQTVGGHAYGSIYPGPIGAVITPTLFDMKGAQDLPFASSLCGACTDICPVKIDLHHLLLAERREIVQSGFKSFVEKIMMGIWRWTMLSPARMDTGGRLLWLMQKIFGDKLPVPGWTPYRRFPVISKKSFRMMMRKNIQ